jgi:hypothetical protein
VLASEEGLCSMELVIWVGTSRRIMRNVVHDGYQMDIDMDPGQGVGNYVENECIYGS